MPEITLEKIESPQNWDDEVFKFNGSLFITKEWLTTVAAGDRIPVYFRFIEKERVSGLLAGLEVSLNKGKTWQLFFYSGIASSSRDPDVAKSCKTVLYEYAKKNRYQRISIRSYDHLSHVPAQVSFFREKERLEYVVFFNKSKEEVIKGIHKDKRRKVRKACEKGMVLRKSNSVEMLDNLISLIGQTYNRRQCKGYGAYEHYYLPFFSSEEMKKLIVNGHGCFYYTLIDNEILSNGLIFCYLKKAYALYAGTSAKGYTAYSPSFFFYNVICTLKDEGYSCFNIGGVQQDERNRGLKQFKDKLGAEIISSTEECSNFLTPPLKYLNPLLDLKHFLLVLKVLPWRLKKAVIFVIDKIIRKRDCY